MIERPITYSELAAALATANESTVRALAALDACRSELQAEKVRVIGLLAKEAA